MHERGLSQADLHSPSPRGIFTSASSPELPCNKTFPWIVRAARNSKQRLYSRAPETVTNDRRTHKGNSSYFLTNYGYHFDRLRAYCDMPYAGMHMQHGMDANENYGLYNAQGCWLFRVIMGLAGDEFMYHFTTPCWTTNAVSQAAFTRRETIPR